MILPTVKRELARFIQDEKATMSKKNILKTGVALTGLIGLSESVSAYHVDSVPHSNSISLHYEDPEAVGQHAHHANHVHQEISEDKKGGGWLFDCFGAKDNIGINDIGEFFSWLNRDYTHWTVTAYHVAGVLFRVSRVNGILPGSHVWKLQRRLTPKRNLHEGHHPFLRALAMHGFEAAQKGVQHIARQGAIEPLLRNHLAHCSTPTENDVKRINWMIASLEATGMDTEWLLQDATFHQLQQQTKHMVVCTSASTHLGTMHTTAAVPHKNILSQSELLWYYSLFPIGFMISVFYKLGLRYPLKKQGLWNTSLSFSEGIRHAKSFIIPIGKEITVK